MPQETEQRRLSAVKSMQNIIDSIIYAMYTRENLERWGSCFGSYSEYSLYSIFANALKRMRFMMKTAAMTTMMAGPRTWVWDVLAPCSG